MLFLPGLQAAAACCRILSLEAIFFFLLKLKQTSWEMFADEVMFFNSYSQNFLLPSAGVFHLRAAVQLGEK